MQALHDVVRVQQGLHLLAVPGHHLFLEHVGDPVGMPALLRRDVARVHLPVEDAVAVLGDVHVDHEVAARHRQAAQDAFGDGLLGDVGDGQDAGDVPRVGGLHQIYLEAHVAPALLLREPDEEVPDDFRVARSKAAWEGPFR